jgi:hypothetical protein
MNVQYLAARPLVKRPEAAAEPMRVRFVAALSDFVTGQNHGVEIKLGL